MITSDTSNLKLTKIRYRRSCVAQLGDKLSSRHGQKGTIGALLQQMDMIYDERGISPDVVINPIAFSSRMTYGQFVETLLGIVCCCTGRIGDATPFSHGYREALYRSMAERLQHFEERLGARQVVDEISDALRHLGLHPYGNRVMRNGITGKRLRCQIFAGMTYMQKLKHMVASKIRARGSEGQINPITKQPAEGRTREGGLRLGEMERDCAVGHGAAFVCQARFMISSDLEFLHICLRCRRYGIHTGGVVPDYCKRCNARDSCCVASVPNGIYAFQQELRGMGIDMKLIPEEGAEDRPL
jgi:DNA-directed RNA polymerase beta subunit